MPLPRPAPFLALRGFAALASEQTAFRDLDLGGGLASGARWTPDSRGRATHAAARIDAPGRLQWRAFAMPGSRVRAWCAVARSSDAPAVGFSLDVLGGGTHYGARAAAAADAWRELEVVLPTAFTGEITVTFGVEGPAGSAALCGDPVLERRRAAGEIVKAAIAALRILGPRGIIRRAAAAASQRDDQERYRRWIAAHAAPAVPPRVTTRALVSIVTPVYNTEPVWLRRCIESVRQQSYPHWEMILSDDGSTDPRTRAVLDEAAADPRIRLVRAPLNGGIVKASNAGLAAATGEFVAFLDHDDELSPLALAEVLVRVDADPGVEVIYTDEDKIDASGARSQPHFKPDWSPELLLSCMYMSHLTVMRRSRVQEAGGFRAGFDGAQDYDLMLRVVERTDRIAHVPGVLYRWRAAPGSAASSQLAKPWALAAGRRALEEALGRRSVAAAVLPSPAAGHFRVRHAIAGAPLVSILIVSTNQGRRSRSLASLAGALARTTTGRAIEILIGSDTTVDPEAAAALGRLGLHVLTIASGSAAAQLNEMARAARGDHLLVFDEAVRPLEGGWLEALLEFSQQEAIGGTGGVLLREDGTIDDAGLVLGAGGVAAPAFHGEPAWTPGHRANALDVRNCAALTARCLLTRRAVYERAGGFDEPSGRQALAIDYSLRVRTAGHRIVVTPHARLRAAAGTIANAVTPAETARLRARWGAQLDVDPYYNPNFDRAAAVFRLPPA